MTNGYTRFGNFFTFLAGVTVANGVFRMDDNLTVGIILVVVGIIIDAMGLGYVDKGTKEAIRLRDLERKAGVRKNI